MITQFQTHKVILQQLSALRIIWAICFVPVATNTALFQTRSVKQARRRRRPPEFNTKSYTGRQGDNQELYIPYSIKGFLLLSLEEKPFNTMLSSTQNLHDQTANFLVCWINANRHWLFPYFSNKN